MDRLYIQPLTLVPSPQAVAGDAIRLGGGMAYAHLIAVTVMRDGKVAQRDLVTPSGIVWALERVPVELAEEAEEQWSGLTTAHPPLQLGNRTIPLDQPQVMGILNVTPDSFSDGGKFMDDPAVRHHDMVHEYDHPDVGRLRLMGQPIVFTDTPTRDPGPPPLLGQHTDEVLEEAGYDAITINELRAKKVVR